MEGRVRCVHSLEEGRCKTCDSRCCQDREDLLVWTESVEIGPTWWENI